MFTDKQIELTVKVARIAASQEITELCDVIEYLRAERNAWRAATGLADGTPGEAGEKLDQREDELTRQVDKQRTDLISLTHELKELRAQSDARAKEEA